MSISIFTAQTFLYKAQPTKIGKLSEKKNQCTCVCARVYISSYPIIAKTMVYSLLIFQTEERTISGPLF